MRIVCLSDTHTMHGRVTVPDGDCVVHAGDWSNQGTDDEARAFVAWFYALPHKHKAFIAGNHDWAATRPHMLEALGPAYMCDSGLELGGLRFWGSPWQPEFCAWAFNLPRGRRLAEKWARVPVGTDVLLTHGPRLGVLDVCPDGRMVGCADLAVALEERIRPALHVCGHIHHSRGVKSMGNTLHVNAASCTERYAPTNAPIVVDVVDGVADVVGG